MVRTRCSTDAGDLVNRLSLFPVDSGDSLTEMQRTSRGKLRLLSVPPWRDQIYVARPCDGYRASSCVADSPRLRLASNLPALYPFGYGAYLYVDPRFFLRLPPGVHCCTTLALGYPSPPSGWVWTLPDTCVIISGITI